MRTRLATLCRKLADFLDSAIHPSPEPQIATIVVKCDTSEAVANIEGLLQAWQNVPEVTLSEKGEAQPGASTDTAPQSGKPPIRIEHRRRTLRTTPEALVRWMTEYLQGAHVCRSDFPKDGRVVGLHWDFPYIDLTVESESFSPVGEYPLYPDMLVKFSRIADEREEAEAQTAAFLHDERAFS